ncbi:MAG: hypothetical protein ABJP45_10900 [Cyclobacteriaceae bacterium]
MKATKHTQLLASVLFILTIFGATAQGVKIADNNFNAPTGDDIYPTIQAAIDAADPGDYVYVQPSPTTYGSVHIEKEIHLVGIGFNLDKDSPLQSTMLDVTLRNNIDNTSDASNSSVTGLTIRDIYTTIYPGAPTITLEGLKISNCQIQELQNLCCGTTYAPVNNMEIFGNYFTESVDFANQATNIIVRNNLFDGNVYFASSNPNSGVVSNNIFYGAVGKASQGDNLIIQNNNFIGATGSTAAFISVMIDAIVVNNIFYGRTPSVTTGGGSTSTNFQRNTFTNNLSFSTGDDLLPPAGGGISNQGSGNLEATAPLLTNVPLLSTWASTYDFTLGAGSLAIDGGSDNSDIGISGGPYPFTEVNFILKTTAIPTIQIFNTSTVINPGDDLDVRVKAKAN